MNQPAKKFFWQQFESDRPIETLYFDMIGLTEGHEKEIQTEHLSKLQPVFGTAFPDHDHLKNISVLFIELSKPFNSKTNDLFWSTVQSRPSEFP